MSLFLYPSRNGVKVYDHKMENFTGEISNPRIQMRLDKEAESMMKEGNLSKLNIYVSMPTFVKTHYKILMGGVKGTPYEGGLIKINMYVPNTYPAMPPLCHFASGLGDKRLHPNYYVDGKICLSLLGTWGNTWSAATKMEIILCAIQERMCEHPLTCEPGYEEAPKTRKFENDTYNNLVMYEVIRVTVVEQFMHWNKYDLKKLVEKDPDTLKKVKGSEVEYEMDIIPKAIELFKSSYDSGVYHKKISALEELGLEGKVLTCLWFSSKLQLESLRTDLENVKKIVDALS